jgi:hypothetical protein
MRNKLKSMIAVAGLLTVAVAVFFGSGNIQVNGLQKQRVESQPIDLDSTIAPLTGKRVMYCLEDHEGGLILESTGQGRKVPAIVTYNYRGLRNDNGILISPLIIFRPAFAGGILVKDDVPSSSDRTPGTWDNFQPGDLRN